MTTVCIVCADVDAYANQAKSEAKKRLDMSGGGSSSTVFIHGSCSGCVTGAFDRPHYYGTATHCGHQYHQ